MKVSQINPDLDSSISWSQSSIKLLSSVELGAPIRKHFPIFEKSPELGYLDSAASSQKPKLVIDRISHYLSYEHSNIHRGAYALSANATDSYDRARQVVQRFLGLSRDEGVIFVKNATEGINLLAHSLEHNFQPNDLVLLTKLEHHSNIVPWQLMAERRRLNLQYVNIEPDGSLDLHDLEQKISTLKPKLLAITAISNAIGSIVPLELVSQLCSKHNCLLAIDASQAVMHRAFNLSELQTDFFVFTGHKIYGPTGIGVLCIKPERFNIMAPFLGGGDMIESVSIDGSTFAEPPRRFEAGTPAIAEAIALATALEFVLAIGFTRIAQHEREIFDYGLEILRQNKGVKLIGPVSHGREQGNILSFNVDGVHPHDLATIADQFGVQIRAGHHCAQPLMHALSLTGTARASLAVYSIKEDFDRLAEAIKKAQQIFKS